ncbi:hypothetical protein [Streptomyces abikoensis]|uniref:Uncharacterized protein n=1 Tax=Streptomyces abikoensis TaxID=97398 RepID=A0ABW7TD52_9ACTN
MSLARRSLMEAADKRFGWRRAYGESSQVDGLLAEQTAAAYADAEAAGHARLATANNSTDLHLQPGVLDVRGRVLADVLYLEGALTGARNRGLAPELIARLEDAVDHGHELTVLLAAAAHCITITPAESR